MLIEAPANVESREHESSSKRCKSCKTISKVWDVFLKMPAECDKDSKAICT